MVTRVIQPGLDRMSVFQYQAAQCQTSAKRWPERAVHNAEERDPTGGLKVAQCYPLLQRRRTFASIQLVALRARQVSTRDLIHQFASRSNGKHA